ncbi:unnamed protein product [Paramecium primaurelia]|uniref:Eukaryotic peptide chain release factor subunit 1 n=1 Tax=Paramecium primaurelia TaxID=5886 RepID=A0A8S1NE10_PARPR|nr:unnamed protein product [Paramecium primaurelia]
MDQKLSDAEIALEQFRLKKLIKTLSQERTAGTSVVSVYIPPKRIISDITNRLNTQYAEAASIKDKANRTSVQEAIQAAILRLRPYNKAPNNGLVVFCGIVQQADGKGEKKISVVIEPYRPLDLSLYFCDPQFHVEELRALLNIDPPFGFIIMDGNGSLFATIQGNSKQIIKSFDVDLPKKHNKGGQSSVRFARLRMEKRHNYLRKVCETATTCFISEDKPNVKGLVLAGSADFKNDLAGSQFFDKRLQPLIISVVDINYGGEQGLNQAVQLSQESLLEVKYIREKNLVGQFFENIDKDTGLVVYGVQDTMRGVESQTIKTLICVDTLQYLRLECQSKQTEQKQIKYVKGNEGYEPGTLLEEKNGEQFVILQKEDLVEHLSEKFKDYGLDFQLITDHSVEGNQFMKGFSGLGGFLRFKMDMDYLVQQEDWKDEDEDFI